MQEFSFDIPLQPIEDEITIAAGVKLFMLRTDLNHPYFGGNKFFKLKYNLEEARKRKKEAIVTFGGAFSNHIAATAVAGKVYGFKTIGIIRGDETGDLNPTLKFAMEQGMELHFVSREIYKLKENFDFIDKAQFSKSTILQINNSFIIPEGGANSLGIKGCSEIGNYITIPYDVICCPCGTGTTLAGIILSLDVAQKALGFQVLKGENYLQNEVDKWLHEFSSAYKSWSINEDYHFGGYAKRTPQLIAFVEEFERLHNIPLDFVYTSKMMFGIYDLMQKNHFQKGQTVIAVHTGGLQGNAGFKIKSKD
ncbi:MAG: 1-aminocyclopropane-carboxylate deaminase [Bacteroidota bacterium]|jgi:1-aminocyclopropane-1-carboxylate deaminase/D-cysteine desulfhydrase-like pyridoxal-dependent ACC family enzyme|nr:1-aminocyclopropane-carboxylate deaminase [Bacteroidota bacterium]